MAKGSKTICRNRHPRRLVDIVWPIGCLVVFRITLFGRFVHSFNLATQTGHSRLDWRTERQIL